MSLLHSAVTRVDDMLGIVRHHRDGAAILRLHRELVFGPSTAVILNAVEDVLRHTLLPIVCDLSGVTETDSSGLAVLITAQETMHHAGRHFVMLNPSERLRTMIEMTHLRPFVDIATDETDAIRRAVEWR